MYKPFESLKLVKRRDVMYEIKDYTIMVISFTSDEERFSL